MSSNSDDYDDIPDLWKSVERAEQIAESIWGELYLVELFKWTDGDYFIKTHNTGQDRVEMLICDGDEGWLWAVLDANEDPPPDQGSLIRSAAKHCVGISGKPGSIDQDRAIELYHSSVEPYSL